MRILQIGKYFPPVSGGMETVVAELSHGLAHTPNVSVECLVSNDKNQTVIEEDENVKVVRLKRWGVFASTPINPSLAKTVKKTPADLLHVHLPNPLVTVFTRNDPRPIVVTYHCDILRYRFLFWFYEKFLIRFLNRVSKIIVSSETLARNSKILKRYPEKVQVIPFGLQYSPANSKTVLKSQEIKKKYPGPIVLTVGRLVRYKGIDDLIKSMRHVEGTLLVVGSGPEEKNLRQLIQEMKLDHKVHLVGFVPQQELQAYYQSCDVFALTSINASEAFGMCLVEALANGKPLVTTDLPTGVREVNKNGETGFLVPVNDPLAIAEALNKILTNNELKEKLEKTALYHFLAHFDATRSVGAHVQLYQQVLKQ